MIDPAEVSEVSTIGELNGEEVKLVKLRGGFYIGIKAGRDGNNDPLAAGSHPAIVKYSIEKKFSGAYHPNMMKSEAFNESKIIPLSNNLNPEMWDKGFRMNMAKDEGSITLSLALKNIEVAKFEVVHKGETVSLKEWSIDPLVKNSQSDILKAMSKGLVSYCRNNQIKNVDVSLAKKELSAADKEWETIKENQNKPKAKNKHKFQAAEWTHPNGHPRCLLCGDEERTDGFCEGVK